MLEVARSVDVRKRGGADRVARPATSTPGSSQRRRRGQRERDLHGPSANSGAAACGVPSYHGATGSIALTGEPRRWPSEPGIPGVVRYWGLHLYRLPPTPHRRWSASAGAPGEVSMFEAPHGRRIVLRAGGGTNGIPVPRPHRAGVRLPATSTDVMIADVAMAGSAGAASGRGRPVGVTPDLTLRERREPGYAPLGGADHPAGDRRHVGAIAAAWRTHVFRASARALAVA